MKTVNLQSIQEEERSSPKGKFQVFQKHVSLALGGVKDTGTWGGGHPFDVAQVRIPPGKWDWPFHYHSSQWEMYLVQEGEGKVRTENGEVAIAEGDSFIHPPNSPHQIYNSGTKDLVILVISNHPSSDVVGYPDTGKWFVKPIRKLLLPQEAPFYFEEE